MIECIGAAATLATVPSAYTWCPKGEKVGPPARNPATVSKCVASLVIM